MSNSCANCDAFRPVDDKQGQCRAHPPEPMIVGVGHNKLTNQNFPLMQSVPPTISNDFWCREHQPMPVDVKKIDLTRLQIEDAA